MANMILSGLHFGMKITLASIQLQVKYWVTSLTYFVSTSADEIIADGCGICRENN